MQFVETQSKAGLARRLFTRDDPSAELQTELRMSLSVFKVPNVSLAELVLIVQSLQLQSNIALQSDLVALEDERYARFESLMTKIDVAKITGTTLANDITPQ